MLQNRVDPWGQLIKTKARGSWMGNRGLLHDERQVIRRPFKLKAWLICLLEFRGRKRKVMSPRLYTELFFMDEATAFAAGHRPCFECRRKDFDHFKSCWLKGNPGFGFTMRTPIASIDAVLHEERTDKRGPKQIYRADPGSLPDGVFVQYDQKACLLAEGKLYPWSPFGYEPALDATGTGELPVLTPGSTVNAFRSGYRPQMRIDG